MRFWVRGNEVYKKKSREHKSKRWQQQNKNRKKSKNCLERKAFDVKRDTDKSVEVDNFASIVILGSWLRSRDRRIVNVVWR